jgi:uncharacterized protein involved in type VI secretion and phage assembly
MSAIEDPRQRTSPRKFLGKYRGTVVDNQDPLQMGRIRAVVPDVSPNSPTGWAMPCVPFGLLQMGQSALPLLQSGVWIEFEQGDADKPIWTGGWWDQGQMPSPQASDAALPSTLNGVVPSVGRARLRTPSPKIQIPPRSPLTNFERCLRKRIGGAP